MCVVPIHDAGRADDRGAGLGTSDRYHLNTYFKRSCDDWADVEKAWGTKDWLIQPGCDFLTDRCNCKTQTGVDICFPGPAEKCRRPGGRAGQPGFPARGSRFDQTIAVRAQAAGGPGIWYQYEPRRGESIFELLVLLAWV